MKNRFILTIIFIISLYLIVSFTRDLWFLRQKVEEAGKGQLNLEELYLENEALKKQLEHVKSQAFLEKEAREKLGMAKEGETTLILPENFKEKLGLDRPQKKEQPLPNWQKWWKLFF